MTFDTITFWLWVGLWLVLGVWELVLVWLRHRGQRVGTISIVLKNNGHRATSLVYCWAGMATHWWWNAAAWGPDALAWIFWGIPFALLGTDVWYWRRPADSAAAWWRRPIWWLVVGALAGRFLFPQRA